MSGLDGLDLNRLCEELAQDEGIKASPYRDTLGNWTIGIGHYIGDDSALAGFKSTHTIPMALTSILQIYANDIGAAAQSLDRNYSDWWELDPIRKRVLLNMCFNMGWGNGNHGLSAFHTFLGLVSSGAYDAAADDLKGR